MFSEIHCIVSGKVQRVGYRDTVDRYVQERGLFGWIQNKEDGSVEILIQGTPDNLKECIAIIHRGSPLSHVENISVNWRTPSVQYDEFKIL